jgi:DNA-binding CsgD family transcriptional regulator
MFNDLETMHGGAPVHDPAATASRIEAMTPWLTLMLDEIDYGMLLLADELQVLHLNHVARTELDEQHPLQMLGRQLRARHPHDVGPLRVAIEDAVTKQRRRLITLGAPHAKQVSAAVIPLAPQGGQALTLVIFGKGRGCQALSMQWYARGHGLTLAETHVLQALCAGASPADIARQSGVAISTVRTHIGSIRNKTRTESIRALLQQVAALPPMVSVLREKMH